MLKLKGICEFAMWFLFPHSCGRTGIGSAAVRGKAAYNLTAAPCGLFLRAEWYLARGWPPMGAARATVAISQTVLFLAAAAAAYVRRLC